MKGGGSFHSLNFFGQFDLDVFSQKWGALFSQLPRLGGKISFEIGSDQQKGKIMAGAFIRGKDVVIQPHAKPRYPLPDCHLAVKGFFPEKKKTLAL